MTASADAAQAIILVDDDANILGIMARIVSFVATGYEVLAVASAREALAAMDGRAIPLVITDYNMPEMNGLALLSEVKQRSPGTVVALVTAYASADLQRQAWQLGASYMLPKPMTIEQIEQVVQEVLGITPDQ
jgi:two-component system, response regulator, stage 0 sporulation protein F